jgi:putative ATP-dependent endonuclease of OLD family
MITNILIQNFKLFRSFELSLNSDLIIVGNNEAGISTILEALALAPTKRANGRQIEQELSCNYFNKTCLINTLKPLLKERTLCSQRSS